MSLGELIIAVRGGNIEKVRAVLHRSKDPKDLLNQCHGSTSESYVTPLMLASVKGHLEIIKLLIEKGADLDLMTNEKSYKENSASALMKAVETKKIEVVKLLLELGAEVDRKNRNRTSALITACKQGSAEIVKSLLSHGADPNDEKYYCSPLLIVVKNGNVKVADILLKNGAKIVFSSLYEACRNGNINIVKTLLKYDDTAVNFMHDDGWSPLMLTSSFGNDDITELLLAHGANIDAENTRGDYPLLLAIKKGHASTVKLLLEGGAQLNLKRGPTKSTALIEAINMIAFNARSILECGKLSESAVIPIVELLLNYDAEVNVQPESGCTALLLAVSNKSFKIVKLLVDK